MGCLSCLGSAVWQNCFLLVVMTVLVTVVQILSTAGVDTEVICITPRTPQGLLGLIMSPLVHKSWLVLFSNLIGMWVLGFLLLMQGHKIFLLTYSWISLVGGMLTFILARPGPQCGMAGELCGFFAFLVCAVVWQRPISLRTILGLVAAMFLYGGSMIASIVVPTGSSYLHSSWESKIFGLLAGGAWALVFHKILVKNARFSAWLEGTPMPPEKRAVETQASDLERQGETPSHLTAKPSAKKPSFGFLSSKKNEKPLHTQAMPLSSPAYALDVPGFWPPSQCCHKRAHRPRCIDTGSATETVTTMQEERATPAPAMSPLYSAYNTGGRDPAASAYLPDGFKGAASTSAATRTGLDTSSGSTGAGTWGPNPGGAWR